MNIEKKVIIGIVFMVMSSMKVFSQWTQFDAFRNQSINDVKIFMNGNIYVAPKSSGFYRSKGLGNKWEAKNVGLPSSAIDIPKIVLAGEMIVINAWSGIYRSANYGDNWEKVYSNSPSVILNPIGFIGGSIFASNLSSLAEFTSLFRSTDYGVTWSPCDSGIHSLSVQAIVRLSNDLYGATIDGIYKSTDFGVSWVPSNTGLKVPLKYLAANGSSLIVAESYYGGGGGSYRSQDKGLTWQEINIGSNLTTTALDTFQTILLRGSFYGGLQSSTNSGTTWKLLFTIPWHTIQCIGVSGDTLIVGEEYYSHIDGSGGLWIYLYSPTHAANTDRFPETFSMTNNYPNPFNPITELKYTIPYSTFVSVKVFNALGCELETLVDAIQPEGKYSIAFDGSKYSSGIYFCAIRTDGFKKTVKMVLQK